MLKFFFENLIGMLSLIFVILNTVLLSALLIPLGILKFLIPLDNLRLICTKFIIKVGELWIFFNKFWVKFLHSPNWEIIGKENLSSEEWSIATSNHQSEADIFLLQDITNRKIPMLKFFMKYILIYVPIIGLSWWALDMPFLKRYSKKDLEKNPNLKGKDHEEMKRALKHYNTYPVTVFSFAEGTRLTKVKHSLQLSPYINLLKPKEGGLATAISLVPKIDSFINFTIIYKSNKRGFWDYLCGRINKAKIVIEKIPIPNKFRKSDLVENETLRREFKTWLNNIWENKDILINNSKY